MPQDNKGSHRRHPTKPIKHQKEVRNEYASKSDNTQLPIRVRTWDGNGRPPNLLKYQTYDWSQEYNFWIPAKNISVDVLAHRMRCTRPDSVGDSPLCWKFCCPASGRDEWLQFEDHHFDINNRSGLILYVFEGERGFIVNWPITKEQLYSLINQSYQYARRNGFAQVEDLSRLEFGVATWIEGSIPRDELLYQGAEGLPNQEEKAYAGGACCEGCGRWIPYLRGCYSCGRWIRDPDATRIDPIIEAAVQGYRFDGQDAAELGIGALIAMGAVVAIAGAVGGGVRR